ncbi:hypothetical protein [Mameliella sediminis]|uniref:hypothetical protein n=1 Tax=Mameliella sediminis TaxID=2836866 RepID=UPI001C46951A|nr:hypothetical protein [Mameliella sediminis]MBV7393340.1 hypothetical protein [Mameliella sediminis]
MFKPVSTLVLAALVLTSCGTVRDSRLNPINWFGRSESLRVATPNEEVNTLIPRGRESIFRKEKDTTYRGTDMGEITELVVERRPGGAIIRATTVADYQGAFDVQLVKIEEESTGGTLAYAFRGYQPRGPKGSDLSRTHTAAVWLTDNQLAGIRTIQVKGRHNIRNVRR